MLSLLRVWVQSLVRELRPSKPRGVAFFKKKKKRKEELSNVVSQPCVQQKVRDNVAKRERGGVG